MTPQDLIQKLQAANATKLAVDFVKECQGRPVDDSFDIVAATLYVGKISETRYVTLHLGTPKMAGGSEPFTLDNVKDEVLL